MNERYIPGHSTLQSYFHGSEQQLPPHSYYQLHLCEKCFFRLSFEIVFAEDYQEVLMPVPMPVQIIYDLVIKSDSTSRGYYGSPPLLLRGFKCGINTAFRFNKTFEAYARFREQLTNHLFGHHPTPLSYVTTYNPGTHLYESILRLSPARPSAESNADIHSNHADIVDFTDSQFPWCFCNEE